MEGRRDRCPARVRGSVHWRAWRAPAAVVQFAGSQGRGTRNRRPGAASRMHSQDQAAASAHGFSELGPSTRLPGCYGSAPVAQPSDRLPASDNGQSDQDTFSALFWPSLAVEVHLQRKHASSKPHSQRGGGVSDQRQSYLPHTRYQHRRHQCGDRGIAFSAPQRQPVGNPVAQAPSGIRRRRHDQAQLTSADHQAGRDRSRAGAPASPRLPISAAAGCRTHLADSAALGHQRYR